MEKLIYRSFIGYRYYIYIDILQCGGEMIGPFGFNALNTILIILKMPMDLQSKLIKLCSWDTLFPGPLSLWTRKNFGPLRAPDYMASQSAPRNLFPSTGPFHIGSRAWDRERDRVWDRKRDRVWDRKRDRVWDRKRDRVWDRKRDRVWDRKRDRVWDRKRDRVWERDR